MIYLLDNLFDSYGFVRQEVENGYFLNSSKTSLKIHYWLVSQQTDLVTLLKSQSELFDSCKKICTHSEFDKNASMLVLVNIGNNLDVKLQNLIMSIEEDPYFFKKQILYYSSEELESLKKQMNGQSLCDFLHAQLLSQEIFSQYKENPSLGTWQSLLYRISMKIPFVNIKMEVSDGLASLFEDNKNRIAATKNGALLEFDKNFFEILESQFENGVQVDNAIELLNGLLPILGGLANEN